MCSLISICLRCEHHHNKITPSTACLFFKTSEYKPEPLPANGTVSISTEGATDSDMNVFPPEGVTVVIENDTVTVTNQTVDIETADEDEDDTGDDDTGEEDETDEGE
jgi:hypothetical protein